MDIAGVVLSSAQTLFVALQYSEIKQICSILGCKSQLNDLSRTVVRIKAALKDAEAKQELSKQDRLFIEELKDAVYDADDLFDEFVTLAEQEKLTKGIKVRVLALFGKYGKAYKMAQGVKMIKKKLDDIASDTRFNFNIDPKPIRNRRLESCSYVYEADIIGRETDLEKIVGVLLDPIVQQNVSFLPIVGMGGLGKTALAQLVFNDARVKNAFPLMMWTCVADENQKLLDIQGLLGKILASATGYMKNEGCTMEWLQSQLRQQLAGKKYLLVLDDVWTENSEQWRMLIQFLIGGQRGSWIVVTTRSKKAAGIIGDGPRHELQGLSKDNSWCLFKRVAFGSQHANPPEDLVELGEDIVVGCANVPLAIRVVGSLLYEQEKHKWLSVQKLGLAKVEGSEDGIIPILKLSYYQLESPLKCCFGYCAIFPKDHRILKMKLIQLWIAQGYIQLDDRHLNMEDVAEELFSILLQRCFFQDVEKDEYGDIESFKIHDLMHDLAQEVVGKEVCVVNTINGDVVKKIRHLSVFNTASSSLSFTKTHIRSYLYFDYKMDVSCVGALLANWKYLRAVDLNDLDIKSLPGSIGELIHLRYLDLSYNGELKVLPGQFTKLHNLQTLSLLCCSSLEELPKDFNKLVKLRVLDLIGCDVSMPRGMDKLTCLHTLSKFVVGDTRSDTELCYGLEDLKALGNLKGNLRIDIPFMNTGPYADKKNGGREGGCLGNKQHLKHVAFYFSSIREGKGRAEYDEAVMGELQPPHPNLERFIVSDYRGVRIPRWPMEDSLATFLPNLVHLEFKDCPNLQYSGQLRLPLLKMLKVIRCPNLIAILHCPALEDLTLLQFNKRLEIFPMRIKSKEFGEATPSGIPTISASSSPFSYDIGPKLRKVYITNVAWLNSLPTDSFMGLVYLAIGRDEEVESLGEAREVFRSCSSSLISLKIVNCSVLKSVVLGGLEHLTALEELGIYKCSKLSLSEEVEREDGVSWQPFHHPLRSLNLVSLPQLVDLPNWIQYMTSLEILNVFDCEVLESVPNWMSKLTSLILDKCSKRIRERCQPSPHSTHTSN